MTDRPDPSDAPDAPDAPDASAPADGPAPATEERILHAALVIFSELGYARATIKRIAEEADIRSTALLYWYHPNKAALFTAVAERYAPVLDRVTEGPDLLALPPERFFARFAGRFLRAFLDPDVQRAYRMLAHEPELLEKAERLEERRPDNVFSYVEGYLRDQTALGTIRADVDAPAAAAAFVGSLASYLLAAGGRSPWVPRPVAPDAFVTTLAEVYAAGLRPQAHS